MQRYLDRSDILQSLRGHIAIDSALINEYWFL